MKKQLRRNRVFFLVAAFAGTPGGCASLLTRDDYEAYRARPMGLHVVETMDLQAQSTSKPVPLSEAAADSTAQLQTTKEPLHSIELTLEQVRATALANNLDLAVELVNPSIYAEAVHEQEAQFEPYLFGAASYGVTDRASSVVGATGVYAKQLAYDAGVHIPLRTGGSIQVDLPINRSEDRTYHRRESSDDPEIIDALYTGALSFSISQPLLRGAGVRANTHAIRVSKYERDITDAHTKLQVINTLAGSDRAYWVLYAARRELEIRKQQHELAIRQLEEARQRVAAGASPQIEIMRAESGVARRLEDIIIADTGVRSAERELKRIMNRPDLPLESPTAILPVTDPNPIGLTLDAESLSDYAVVHRMEILELQIRTAIDDSTVDFERNALLPSVTLDYQYTNNGLGGSYNDVLRGVGRSTHADYSIGLTAELPLGNQAAKARWRRAKLERLQRTAEKNQLELAIRQEVRDALDQLAQNWQRILAAGQEVVLAGRTWEAERRQFEVGLRTSTEVLEAAARVATAQSREVRALAAYEISQVDIAVATGSLLGKDSIVWSPRSLD